MKKVYLLGLWDSKRRHYTLHAFTIPKNLWDFLPPIPEGREQHIYIKSSDYGYTCSRANLTKFIKDEIVWCRDDSGVMLWKARLVEVNPETITTKENENNG